MGQARQSSGLAGFVGRRDELAALRSAWDAASAGTAFCVLIEGPAGVGKTALIRRFLSELDPFRRVLATGEEVESAIDYALADQLLRVRGEDGLGSLSSAANRDLASVGLRLIHALGEKGSDSACAVAIDDAHWADAASLRALLFALRRMHGEALLVLLAVRDGEVDRVPDGLIRLAGSRRLALGGLSRDEVAELAEASGATLSPRAAENLRQHTRGVPVYIRALLDDVSADVWEERQPLPPAPDGFARQVSRALHACSSMAQAFVKAASVLGVRVRPDLAARLAGTAEPLDLVEEAQSAGLLEIDAAGGTTSFAHPLTRAAVYHGLGPAERARLHLAAADLVEHPGAALAHRAAALSGPDPELAGELAGFAALEAARGAWASAGEALRHAAQLSVDANARERFELGAVEVLLYAGHVSAARARLREIEQPTLSPLHACALAHLAIVEDRGPDAERLLARAWELRGADRTAALAIAERFAYHWITRLRGDEALEWSRRAVALGSDDDLAGMTAWSLPMAMILTGELASAEKMLDQSLSGDGGGQNVPLLRIARGWARFLGDDLAGALEDLSAAASGALQLGIEVAAAQAYAWLCQAHLARGAWDLAAVAAERAVALAVAGETASVIGNARLAAITLCLERGDLAAALEHASLMPPHPQSEALMLARATARARIASARSRPDEALEALAPIGAASPRGALDEPGMFDWPLLQADALLRVGRVADADELLRPHERLAGQSGRRSAIARLARLRGRIEAAHGRATEAQHAYSRALELASSLPMPYELALAQLAYGQFLRRAGQRRQAAAVLTTARECFVELRARPALERCERELAASGLQPAKRKAPDRGRLTQQERTVAHLAAQGMSNREIADELLVSVKTIETHLSRVFAKLDISSRTQLTERPAHPS